MFWDPCCAVLACGLRQTEAAEGANGVSAVLVSWWCVYGVSLLRRVAFTHHVPSSTRAAKMR